MLGGKSGGNCEGQEFVLCIGRGLVRANGIGIFWDMVVRRMEQAGEMDVQGREKTEENAYEARRSSSPSSRREAEAGAGGRVTIYMLKEILYCLFCFGRMVAINTPSMAFLAISSMLSSN